MRRNLKLVQTETRTGRTAAPRASRTSTTDLLEPISNPEALWEEDDDESRRQNGQTEESDTETEAPEGEPTPAPEEKETEESTGPDDALGLYLRQMGAIPLLTR